MVTKHCPQIKECERRVKRSTESGLHAFLCSELTEMQDVPSVSSLSSFARVRIVQPEEREEGETAISGIIKESLFSLDLFWIAKLHSDAL